MWLGSQNPKASASVNLPRLCRARAEYCDMNGSIQLGDYPGEVVRLSCEKWGRSGHYRKQKLIERYGADIPAGNCTVQPTRANARRLHGALCRLSSSLLSVHKRKGP